MGWGRFLLLGNIGQQMDLSDHKERINGLKKQLATGRKARAEVAEQIVDLQAENDELRLYLASVVRLLVSKGVVTQEELRDLVAAIDAEDGSADGRFAGDIA